MKQKHNKINISSYQHQPEFMKSIASSGGKKGGQWKMTKDGRTRAEVLRGTRKKTRTLSVIPPKI